jgi:hypothetical protein
MLSDINFYDEKPSDMNSFSLYDYLVKGTQRAIKECVLMMKDDLAGGAQSQTQEQSQSSTEV